MKHVASGSRLRRTRSKERGIRAILAVLLGCGLRRRELANLEFAHLQQREEHWAIVDLVGKGGPYSNRACARMGQKDHRSVGGCSWNFCRKIVPMCLSGRQTLGGRRNGTSSLACRETVREEA